MGAVLGILAIALALGVGWVLAQPAVLTAWAIIHMANPASGAMTLAAWVAGSAAFITGIALAVVWRRSILRVFRRGDSSFVIAFLRYAAVVYLLFAGFNGVAALFDLGTGAAHTTEGLTFVAYGAGAFVMLPVVINFYRGS